MLEAEGAEYKTEQAMLENKTTEITGENRAECWGWGIVSYFYF